MTSRGVVEAKPLPFKVLALKQFEVATNLLNQVDKVLQEEEGFSEEHRITTAIEHLRPAEKILIQMATSHADLLVSPSTHLACSSCFCTDAETYYLKKSAGKYAVLCFDRGNGCWEKSARTCCTYTDQHQAQCEELAEFEVVYGPDGMSRRSVCGLHVGAILNADVSMYKIYPLDLD